MVRTPHIRLASIQGRLGPGSPVPGLHRCKAWVPFAPAPGFCTDATRNPVESWVVSAPGVSVAAEHEGGCIRGGSQCVALLLRPSSPAALASMQGPNARLRGAAWRHCGTRCDWRVDPPTSCIDARRGAPRMTRAQARSTRRAEAMRQGLQLSPGRGVRPPLAARPVRCPRRPRCRLVPPPRSTGWRPSETWTIVHVWEVPACLWRGER